MRHAARITCDYRGCQAETREDEMDEWATETEDTWTFHYCPEHAAEHQPEAEKKPYPFEALRNVMVGRGADGQVFAACVAAQPLYAGLQLSNISSDGVIISGREYADLCAARDRAAQIEPNADEAQRKIAELEAWNAKYLEQVNELSDRVEDLLRDRQKLRRVENLLVGEINTAIGEFLNAKDALDA